MAHNVSGPDKTFFADAAIIIVFVCLRATVCVSE